MQVTAPTDLNGFNVNYWWQSGHPVREEFGLLLTQSGHREPPINEAPDDAGASNFVRSFQLDSFGIFALCPCAAASTVERIKKDLAPSPGCGINQVWSVASGNPQPERISLAWPFSSLQLERLALVFRRCSGTRNSVEGIPVNDHGSSCARNGF